MMDFTADWNWVAVCWRLHTRMPETVPDTDPVTSRMVLLANLPTTFPSAVLTCLPLTLTRSPVSSPAMR